MEMANIVAYDSSAAAHTFVPISITREGGKVKASWREESSSIPIAAQSRIEAEAEQLKSGVFRVYVKTVVPVMETVSGQNAAGYTAWSKVAHELTGSTTFLFSPRANTSERTFLHTLHGNVTAGRSTNLAAVTAAIISEMVDSHKAPF